MNLYMHVSTCYIIEQKTCCWEKKNLAKKCKTNRKTVEPDVKKALFSLKSKNVQVRIMKEIKMSGL